MITKHSATILLAAAAFLLTQCGQPTESKTEETPAPPQLTQEEQRQMAIEEAEKTFRLDVVDEYFWRGKEHLIQVVNVENEDVEALKDIARKMPPSKSLYLYCFRGDAPALDAALKANTTLEGAIAVKAFIKEKKPFATLHRFESGENIVYSKGFAE